MPQTFEAVAGAVCLKMESGEIDPGPGGLVRMGRLASGRSRVASVQLGGDGGKADERASSASNTMACC